MDGLRLFCGLATSLILGLGAQSLLAQAASPPSGERPTASSPAPGQEVQTLQLAKPVKRSLGGGQSHSYRIHLEAGQFARVVVDQQGIDVAVSLIAPDGRTIVEVDSPNFAFGPEPLSVMAAATGDYCLDVMANEPTAPAGNYEIALREVRMATDRDKRRVAAQTTLGDAHALRADGKAQSLQESVAFYEEATRLWQELEEPEGEARALCVMAEVLGRLGSVRRKLEVLQRTLALQASLGDPGFEAATNLWIGLAHRELGDLDKAVAHLDRAVTMQRALGDRVAEANSLAVLGQVQKLRGDYQAALMSLRRALSIMRSVGDRNAAAICLNNIAAIEDDLGELDDSLRDYETALGFLRTAGDRRNEAITLNNIGRVYYERAEWSRALEDHTLALQIRREIGDRRGEAYALKNLGETHLKLGANDKALEELSRALEIRRDVGDRSGEVASLQALGGYYAHLGQTVQALDFYNRALELQRSLADVTHEPETLAAMARALRQQGRLLQARERAQQAVSVVESLRARIATPMRASYLGLVRGCYELEIELLMQLHRENPGERLDLLALQASERARARSLIDLLTEARANFQQGADAGLLEKQRSVREALRSKLEAQTRLLAGKHTDEQSAAAAGAADALASELQQIDSDIRAAIPQYAALTQPEPLDAAQIQGLLDEDTLLLEYALGEERSFLWAVRRDAISSFELPGRATIEGAARKVYATWVAPPGSSRSTTSGSRENASELSEMILGPVAELLGNKRLVFVGEGALQYVPLGAIPLPAREGIRPNGAPLVADHEIVSLPSASILAILRQERQDRRPPQKTVAVLADPVFARADSRVGARRLPPPGSVQAAEAKENALTQSARDIGEGGAGLDRLPFTRREARAILRLVPPAGRKEALDFDANLATATSQELARYRYVHFATHGFLNAVHPELSGLVLSLVDDKGNDREGFLPATEVFSLKLSADLVVLSACRTALGKEIRGEGLVGLTRAFMYAGAPRVVASLWRVDDAATAELMKRFYEGMLGPKKLRPAAALREAQLSLRRLKRWEQPYYWAGFVLQGEWR